MRIEYYFNAGVAGCCANKFYALVFNRSSQCLKDNGSGVLEFAAFTSANQGLFDIPLAEHAQRTRFYYTDILDANINMAATTIGQKFTVEIWKAASAGTPHRVNDTLVETREFIWNGTEYVDAELGAAQLAAMAIQDVQVAIAYDSSESKLRCMAFLEKNGELQADPVSATFSLISRADVGRVGRRLDR
mgnify:CR=1 FL=1